MVLELENKKFIFQMPGEKSSPGIFRYALGIEYRGTKYCGWQRQNDQLELVRHSVQWHVENAISQVADENVTVICAGRTDSGVHAREQVVHFDTRSMRPDKAWVLGVNTHLPDDISVRWVKSVGTEFHARFSATARTYRYVINNAGGRPALSRELMTWIRRPLDHKLMHYSAQHLLGENDFSSFRGSSCQSKSPWRFVHHVITYRSAEVVTIEIKANAFLHHMVRNIAGVLISVGQGDHSADWVKEVMLAKTRTAASITASANGLYLVCVDYPESYGLPQLKPGTLGAHGFLEDMLGGKF